MFPRHWRRWRRLLETLLPICPSFFRPYLALSTGVLQLKTFIDVNTGDQEVTAEKSDEVNGVK